MPGNDSALIWSADVVPYAELPKVIDPPGGWVQNCNDSPWTCTHPMVLDPADWTPHIDPEPRHTPRAQRSIRLLSRPGRISLSDLKAMKLSTRVELADHFVDDLVAAAQGCGGERARRAAGVLQRWDRATENGSDGALLFYRFVGAAGEDFTTIGGYGVPPDPGQPLTTPRGFAAPERAVAALDAVAAGLEREYGTLQVRWGDVARLRRGSLDLPGNGAPNELGAIRTSGLGPFAGGSAAIVSGDTFYAVVEFSDPVRGEALIGYGNWSRAGSQHVSDQLELASQKRLRPILRQRREIEAALEHRQGLRN